MKKHWTFLLIFVFLYSCSLTKYVPENKHLLVKNAVVVDSVASNSEEINQYLVQRPNYKALGVPLSLYFYNMGNPRGSEDVLQWRDKHLSTYNTTAKIFSGKQAGALANYLINLNQWFLNNGESPVVIDAKKIKKSEKNLKTYFQNKGYFNAKIQSKEDTVGFKKGKITYFIDKGEPLIIDSVSTKIKSKVLGLLYRTSKTKPLLKESQQYNDKNFVGEADRLTALFRNKGVFHFNQNSISFDVDTLSANDKAIVNTQIDERVVEKGGVLSIKPYKVQRIKKINVYTDFYYSKKNDVPVVSEAYRGVNFYAFEKLRYKPKYLYESIFIKPDQIYSDENRSLTRKHLRGLKNFKTTNIRYRDLNDDELEANIYLTPLKRYSSAISGELSRSNIRIYDVSAKYSYTNRNTFRGSEIFKISGYGAYFRTEQDLGWEIGTDVSLEFPRFILFGGSRLVPKRMFPKTRFFGGTSVQKNIGLDRQIYNLGIDYRWDYTPKKSMQIELFNTQYVRNFNVHQYFNIYRSERNKLNAVADKKGTSISGLNYDDTVKFIYQNKGDVGFQNSNPVTYQSLLNILSRHNIVTSNFLIPVISYSYTYNSQENLRDKNFSYLKVRLANSGNVLGYVIKESNYRDKTTLFNIPVAQYFKLDAEYKQFWKLSKKTVLGFRLFGGIIVPYNESDIPFSKSYFAGGSNDIRSWKTYDLGPGNRSKGLEYNVGDFKLLGNVEYRFDLIGSLEGALFVDAGNIWEITYTDVVDDPSKLNDLKDFRNIAVGSGLGIRYDFKFLVARLDLGFKMREPYLANDKWFQNVKDVQYNIGINYPF